MRCIRRRGKKGIPHLDPADPPRRRGNKQRGHGTWDNDRPPILGVVGRDTGKLRLEVVHHSTRSDLEPRVLACTMPGTIIYTDEWHAYAHLPEYARSHSTVCHNPTRPGGPEFARDDDGDGIREVHCNTLEGTWTGLRNFLRPFRGISKHYLNQYIAIFEWASNLKAVTNEFIKALAGRTMNHKFDT